MSPQTIDSNIQLASLPLPAFWSVLDNARKIPLADLILHVQSRQEEREESGIKSAVIDTLQARAHRLRGERRECIRLLKLALPVLESRGARDFAVTGYLEQSHAEIDWGDYGAAIASLESAETLIEQGVDRILAARVKAALGRIYSRIGNHHTAMRLILAAREDARKAGALNLAATWSINLSAAATRAWEASALAGDTHPQWIDESGRYLDDAANYVSLGADDPLLGPLIDTNRACLMTFRGLPQKAIPLHAACDAYLTEHAIDALISSNRVDWAKALIAAGQLEDAKSIAESVVARANRGGHLYAQSEAMRLMADLHEARGDSKGALAALRQHNALAARVAAIEALQRADALQVRLETQRVKAEAEATEARNTQLRELNSRLSQQEAELRALSEQDHLTGVANRRRFDARLEVLLAAGVSGDARGSIAVGLIDIDHFKQVNDTFSHAAGDAVLVAVAEALCTSLRQHDLAARLGGDEFAFIAAETDAASARDIAARVAKHLKDRRTGPLPGANQPTLSIGIALARSGDSPACLLQRADAALYRVKRRGRDGIEVDGTGESTAADQRPSE